LCAAAAEGTVLDAAATEATREMQIF